MSPDRPGRPAPGEAPVGDPVVSTYHAYAGRLVADHALREALEPSLRLITPAVAWQLAARVVAAYDGPMDAVDWRPAMGDRGGPRPGRRAGRAPARPRPTSTRRPSGWTAGLPDAPRPGARAGQEDQRLPAHPGAAAAAGGRLRAAKAAREVIDYGDQMALAARIASRHPEVGAVERARYQVVLLDEYQDTSHAQLVLLRALFGGGHPVTAVGDPCQSIYGWRGASAGNLRRFAADFPVARGNGNGPACRRRPPGPGQAAVHQLPQHRAGAGRRRRHAAGAARRGARGAAAGRAARRGPDAARVVCALLDTAADEAALGRVSRSQGCWTCRRARPRTGSPGRIRQRPRPSGRHRGALPQAVPVPRAAGRASRRAGSRSRWSASAGC